MSLTVPITEFAPGERVAIDVVRRQASAVAQRPLTNELFNALLNYVLILNPQRQIVFASRNWQELAPGKRVEDLLGLRPGEALGCIHADERDAGCGTTGFCQECGAVKAILASLAGKQDLQECRVTRSLNSHEEALDLLVFGTPFRVEGEIYSLLAVTDISHEKRRAALERVLFHDVLNAAETLAALTDTLVESATENCRETAQRLRAGVRELLDPVQALRDLAAAERRELAVQPVALNPGALLQEVVGLHQKQAGARHCQLGVGPEPVTTELTTDPTLLKRVLGHLIKNALEAAQPGESVRASCAATGESVRFEVHNPGFMPQGVQLQIFDRSFSTRGMGRGLGTYSVKLLTEQYLKGQAGFTTYPEEGTTFFILLPKRL